MATWTSTDPRWLKLTPTQRATAMALMEADGMDPVSAKNALAAMLNRSAKSGEPLGDHVSKPIYQPTIEPAQQARLDRILASKQFPELQTWADRRMQGLEDDPVKGATHFLAPEKTMLALEASNPGKYKNWGPRGANWTGYDPSTGEYRGVITRDGSHAFLAPEGAHSIPYTGKPNTAMNSGSAGVDPDGFAGVSGPIHTSIPGDVGVPSPNSPPPSMSAPGGPSTLIAGAFKAPGMAGLAGGIGAFAKGLGGGGEEAAQMQRANEQAIADSEREAQSALDLVRKRPKLRMKPRMGAFA